jgi:hypothetical protein
MTKVAIGHTASAPTPANDNRPAAYDAAVVSHSALIRKVLFKARAPDVDDMAQEITTTTRRTTRLRPGFGPSP